MKFLFYLSGEHPDLPKSEILAILEGEEIPYKIEYGENRLLIVDAGTKNFNFINRTAMTKTAAEFVIKSDNLSEVSNVINHKISNKDYKTFAVRCRALNSKNSMEIERELGKKIQELSGLGVNLKNPDITISYLSDIDYFAGIKLNINNKNFNLRKAQHRPYFSPVSMHPKIARVLVNLARVKTGDVILDPFCGTGGILIEAGLIGMEIIGRDYDKRMVKGCRENLKFYGIGGEIQTGDALELNDIKPGAIDAIVTDPPYGRSSFVSDKEKNLRNLIQFYNNFLDSAKRVLRKGKFLVIVLPHEHKLNFNSHGYEVCEFHDVRMHKSLTRRIWVLKKESKINLNSNSNNR